MSFPQNDATAGPGGGNVNQPLVARAAPLQVVGMERLDEGAVHQHVGGVKQRLIDLNRTRAAGEIVLYTPPEW